MTRVAPLCRADWILALGALALTLMTRWRALAGPIYAVDDYLWLPLDFDYALLAPFNNSQGRFLIPVIAEVLHALGTNLHRAQTFGILVLAMAQVATGMMICRLWGIASGSFTALLVVVFICLFPYQVEFYLWRGYAAFFGVAFAVSIAGVVLIDRGGFGAIAGGGLILVGLLIYQSGFLLALTAIVIAAGLDGARALVHGGAVDPRGHGRRLVVALAALAIYAPAVLAVHAFAEIHDPLGRISTANLDPVVIRRRAVAAFDVLIQHDRMLPPLLRMVNFAFVVAAAAGVLRWIAGRRDAALGHAALAVAALLAAPVISVAFSIVLPSFSYREYGTLGVAWAGALAMAMLTAPALIRAAIGAVAAVAILGFIGINDEVIREAERLTQRERALVGRIARRVEMLDREGRVVQMAIVGVDATPAAGLRFVTSPSDAFGGYVPVRHRNVIDPTFGFNTGDIYAVPVMNELSGRHFALAPATTDVAQRCRDAASWPAAHSVRVDGVVAVVCMTTRP